MLPRRMVLSAAMVLALLAAQPDPSEPSVTGAARAARLVAQAPYYPSAGSQLSELSMRALRVHELAIYRRALESQLHSAGAGTTFIAVGGVAMGVGAAWGLYAWAALGFGASYWGGFAALISGGVSLLSGVVMLILGVVMRGQIERHNSAVTKRIDEVDQELERLQPAEGEPEAAPPPPSYPPSAPVPVI